MSGSRHATPDDALRLYGWLFRLHRELPIDWLIQGAAKGVDTFALHWAMAHDIGSRSIGARWREFGKGAGHLRNGDMLRLCPNARLLALPKGPSPGTRNFIRQARAMGREVLVVEL